MDERTPPPKWLDFAQGAKPWQKPFLRAEHAIEWLVFRLRRWAVIDLLEIVGRFAVLVALVTWLLTRGEAREREQVGWWQILSSTEGKRASGARVKALEELVAGDASLEYINLTAAIIQRARLSHAQMAGADLDSTAFSHTDLSSSSMFGATGERTAFMRTQLTNADFKYSVLEWALFQQSDLKDARFDEAHLPYARFVGCNLESASFKGAHLRGSSFTTSVSGADFSDADLQGANLMGARDWRRIRSLKGAKLAGARLPQEFASWARDSMGADLERGR